MLHHKHLKPWLLIYLIATVFLFLSACGIIAIIIINEINGFNFISVQFSTCLTSTNIKFNKYMQTILQVCFILSIGAIVFALGQSVLVIWQFVMFRKWAEQNDQSKENTFEDLSFKKLIVLYILNFVGFLCLIPIVGSFLSFYMEMSRCSGPQNKSSTFFIPAAVAGGALLFQIWCFCMLLKLFYHFNDSKANQKKPTQSDSMKKERQKQQMQEIKQRILQSRKNYGENKYSPNEQNYLSNSTDQQSPRQMENNLLNKNPQNNNYNSSGDTIYGNRYNHNTPNQAQGPSKNKYSPKNSRSINKNGSTGDNKMLQQQLGNSTSNSANSNLPSKNLTSNANINQPSSKKSSTNKPASNNPSEVKQLSPQQISQKQKQVMKKLPKHPYKKNEKSKLKPSDVIFEQSGSEQEGSQYNQKSNQKRANGESVNNNLTTDKPTSKPTTNSKNNQPLNSSNNKSSNQKNSNSSQSNINNNRSSQQNQQNVPHPSAGNTSFQSPGQSYQNTQPNSNPQTLGAKYMNSHYLKHLSDKNISPEQRRKIKRPFLKLTSSIVEFDAKNYQIQDFIIDDENSLSMDKLDRKKSKNKSQTPSLSESRLLNLPENKNIVGDKQGASSEPYLIISRSTGNLSASGSQNKIGTSRLSSYLMQKSILEAQNLQDENPILDYINEDQNYEDKLTKIIQFQKFSKKRRRNIYNPFQMYQQAQIKQGDGKLYLHKNKMDGYNKGMPLTQNQQMIYDPFRDQALDEDINTQRALLLDDDMSGSAGKNGIKSEKKLSLKQTQTNQLQAKKARKEGMLLDFIRSKHVID